MAVTRRLSGRAKTLDNPALYAGLDPSGMRSRLADMGAQLRDAYQAFRSPPLPPLAEPWRAVVVAGMGGSAVGGDLLSDLLHAQGASIPLFVWRDYGLPSWAGTDTLVVVSSYSGETEESLSALREAGRRGCRLVAVTGGGRLESEAGALGVPVLRVPHLGEPRNALAYTLLGPLAVLERAGLAGGVSEQVEETAALLEALAGCYDVECPASRNPAKELAFRASGRLLVVYGGGLLAAAARRWKTDFNENAKCWAFAETLPELNHNTINGYELPSFLPPQSLVVLLQSERIPPRTLLRYRVTAELLERSGLEHISVDAQGRSPLSQIMSTVYLGSWASYYLAILYGLDPSPIPGLDLLKRRLAESGPGPQ